MTASELIELLGGDSAVALTDWADGAGLTIDVPVPAWRAEAHTGALVTVVLAVHPRTGTRPVVVKRLAPGRKVDLHANVTAYEECPEAFRPHLTRQVRSPLRTSSGRTLLLQSPGSASADLRPMALLSPTATAAACATVVRAVLADWNADRTSRPMAALDLLRMAVPDDAADGRTLVNRRQRPASPWVCVDGLAMPDPMLLTQDASPLSGLTLDIVEGRGLGGLHAQDVLLSMTTGGAEPDPFLLVDLTGYQARQPIDRDLVMLLLSVLTPVVASCGDDQGQLLLDLVTDPDRVPRQDALAAESAIVRAVYGTAAGDLHRHPGPEAWRRQYLLSLVTHGLTFSTYESLGPVVRWWCYRLAGRAALLLCDTAGGVRVPKTAPIVGNPFLPSGAGRIPGPVRGLLASSTVRGLDLRRDPPQGNRVSYPGQVKVAVCRALCADWEDLADYLEVPPHVRAGFPQGREASETWQWIEARFRLGELAPALRALGRPELADLLDDNERG
ncbi:hypothetical protein AB0J85_14495 [Micromonospora echinofusca]|uniref:hypothetical protein n=1 Tax=Micromonospora echinofusca TaxID=47858 RepID=UPI0034134EC9